MSPLGAEPITGKEMIADARQPVAALAEFYRAFNNRDLALMERNWGSGDDVVMNNPLGGVERGWDNIKTVYERIFSSQARVEVAFHDYKLLHYGEVFLAIGRERGRLVREDTHFDLAIRTSRFFRFAGGRWRQIHHHGSIDEPALLARYQLAVR